MDRDFIALMIFFSFLALLETIIQISNNWNDCECQNQIELEE